MLKSLWRCALITLVSAVLLAEHAYADEKKRVSVPSGDLATALNSLAQQTGVEFVYQTDALKGLRTRGVTGDLSPHDAVAKLLEGSPLVLYADSAGAMLITSSMPADSMPVVQPTANAKGVETASPPPIERKTTPEESQSNLWHTIQVAQAEVVASQQDRSVGEEGDEARLEQVIVTAQKRTENLQVVPISAQVINSQALAAQNHTTLEELTQIVPEVHVGTNELSNDIYIRGIGSGQNPGFDQSVATFVDDIYHGRSRLSQATFLDLDRIEILKGPQSTFFGNNAIAGALNIVTKKPGDTFDASARLLYGQFGQYTLEGAIGGPITDSFGARLAVTRNGDGRGWIDNVNTGQEVPIVNNEAARLTLVYRPIEALEATLKIEGSRHAISGASTDEPYQWANCPPPSPIPSSFGGFAGNCAQALALGPLKVPMGDVSETSGLPGQGNWLSTSEDVLTINYREWEHTFTSVSGFYNYHFSENTEGVLLPVALNANQLSEDYHQFSQEIRVASPSSQPIEYLAGGYFQTDSLDSFIESQAPFLDSLASAIPPLAPYVPLGFTGPYDQVEHDYSVFASLRWNVTDRLKLNAGLRGSWVYKSSYGNLQFGMVSQLPYGAVIPAPVAIGQIILPGETLSGDRYARSDHAWMPSAGIQYLIEPDVMAYFSYNRGFLAGGLNGENPTGPPPNIEFGPEFVNAYEVGVKGTWLAERLRVNVDVFRSDYSDLQVSAGVYDPQLQVTTFAIRNAATSRSQGIELETQWAVTKDFSLGANIAYLDSRYLSYPNGNETTLQKYCSTDYVLPYCSQFPTSGPQSQVYDDSGKPTSYAPRWSGNVIASYGIPLPGNYRLTTELSPFFTSSYWTSSGWDDVIPEAPGYVRLDGRLSLESPNRHWALDLIGKNITNRTIVSNYASLYVVQRDQPRNIAGQFRYRF
jgi:iron complex outermembrane receptor protein